MAVSQYATAIALNRPAPVHVADNQWEDQDRVRAYGTYEDIWNNVPEAFSALLRASDDPLSRRYVPAVRSLIESVNRYLAVDMETTWTPIPGNTISDQDMLDFTARFQSFWAREEVGIKLQSAKRWMLIKADALIAISADPAKPEGSRIRITEIEPEQYFPLFDPADGERILGVYLASIVLDDEGEEVIQRIEYRRIFNEEQSAEFGGTPVGGIFYRVGYFELDGWDDREDGEEALKPVQPPSWAQLQFEDGTDLAAGVPLPAQITSIPVYHIRNRRRGGKAGRFGTSEIQGLESILAGITQNTSDEDVASAMAGLGFYWTDSGRPRDENGRELPWEVGAAVIAEVEAGKRIGRVEGVGTVQPIQDHISLLKDSAREANGIPEIAAGKTNSATASSGVALRIEFMPILSSNAEREEELASRFTQFLWDLTQMWFPAYEGWSPLPLQPGVVFGDPLPVDRAAVIAEVRDLVATGIASKDWAVGHLKAKLGYDFPADMLQAAAAERQAELDAMGSRLDQEMTGGGPAA